MNSLPHQSELDSGGQRRRNSSGGWRAWYMKVASFLRSRLPFFSNYPQTCHFFFFTKSSKYLIPISGVCILDNVLRVSCEMYRNDRK